MSCRGTRSSKWKKRAHHLDAKYNYCLDVLAKHFRRRPNPSWARIAARIRHEGMRTSVTLPGVDVMREAIFDMRDHALSKGNAQVSELAEQLALILSGIGPLPNDPGG